jgi:hypothetical protein
MKLTFLPQEKHPSAKPSTAPLRRQKDPDLQKNANGFEHSIFFYLKVLIVSSLLAAACVIRYYLIAKKRREDNESAEEVSMLQEENVQENRLSLKVEFDEVYRNVRSARIHSFPFDDDFSKDNEPSIRSNSGLTVSCSDTSSEDDSPTPPASMNGLTDDVHQYGKRRSSNSFDFGDVYDLDNAHGSRISSMSDADDCGDDFLRTHTSPESVDSYTHYVIPEGMAKARRRCPPLCSPRVSHSDVPCRGDSPVISFHEIYTDACDAKIETFDSMDSMGSPQHSIETRKRLSTHEVVGKTEFRKTHSFMTARSLSSSSGDTGRTSIDEEEEYWAVRASPATPDCWNEKDGAPTPLSQDSLIGVIIGGASPGESKASDDSHANRVRKWSGFSPMMRKYSAVYPCDSALSALSPSLNGARTRNSLLSTRRHSDLRTAMAAESTEEVPSVSELRAPCNPTVASKLYSMIDRQKDNEIKSVITQSSSRDSFGRSPQSRE